MADEIESAQRSRVRNIDSQPPPAFQEVPGESEADAARDAFLRGAGPQPADVASALASADGGLRASAVSRLQQERGNAYIQRVVAETRGAPGRLVGSSQGEMVDEVLQRKGAGSALPDETRGQMEGFFGADLGGVRVHTDGEAAALNRELNAQAFTVGSDVFFSPGTYSPASREGQGLLAHELTHVGQQGGFGGSDVQRQAEEEEQPPPGDAALAAPEQEEEAAGE